MRENLRRELAQRHYPRNPGAQFRWVIIEANADKFSGTTITRRVEDSVENSVPWLRHFLMTEAL